MSAFTWSRGFIPGLHLGVDLAASTGTPIHAPLGGRVLYASDTRQDPSPPTWSYWQGRRGAAGIAALVDVGAGRQELYAHMSQLRVRAGQSIGAGDVVGLVGATGYAFGSHLHLGELVNGHFVDPMTLWVRAQLIAAVGSGAATAIPVVANDRTPQQALDRLASIGIPTDRGHQFTPDEALRIATQLYEVTGGVAESIAHTLTGKTVQWFVDAWVSGSNTNVSPDPIAGLQSVADAIAGIPGALVGLLWFAGILVLVLVGLYVLVTPGGSSS